MFSRLATSSLLSLLLACASGDLVDVPATSAADMEAGSSLQLESTGSDVSILPGMTVELAVRYRAPTGTEVRGKVVEFALAGMASGASLTPARAATNEFGVATTRLRAGNMAGTLQVRAGSDGVEPVAVQVHVGETVPSDLEVRLDYAGNRGLASYTVTALPGLRCDRALSLGVTGPIVHRIEDPREAVSFQLAPGFTASIVAWGSDDTGSRLARGCFELTAPIKEKSESAKLDVNVTLDDLPLRLQGSLDVELAVAATSSAKRCAETSQRVVQRAVSPSGGIAMFVEADYYLDAIAALLESRASSDALAQLKSARASTALSASLAPALSKQAVGPVAVGSALASLFSERGSVVRLVATLEGTALGALRSIEAQSGDGARTLPLGILPTARLNASYDDAMAELAVAELRVELGLGAYGRALLNAVRNEDAAQFFGALESAGGCREVVGPWADAQLPTICARDCAIAACERAVAELVSDVEAGLLELDASGSALTLAGSVPAHDRTGDGVVDDLGPAPLEGRWSTSDAVSGELREPSRNALTL